MAKLAADTYGEALFSLAVEENKVDRLFEETEALKAILDQNPDFNVVMNHPKITRDQKEKMIEEVFHGRVSDEITQRFGRIDVLVNNAGIAQIKLFTDTDENDWNRIMGVNAGGIYNMCRAIVPQMISRKNGRIINMSSMWGISGASCEVIYSASKAAVIGFTKALAKELGPSGITVNCIAPGVIDTEMNAELDDETRKELTDEIPLERFGSPEDVAGAVLFLASDQASYITGQVLGVDGGIL